MDKIEIVIIGWNPGFNKVQASKLFRSELGDNLADSKRKVDMILKNKEVVIHTGTQKQSERIKGRLVELGARIKG